NICVSSKMVTSGATRVYLRHVPGFALGEVLAFPRVDEVPATARSAKIFDDQAARKVVSQKHKKPEETCHGSTQLFDPSWHCCWRSGHISGSGHRAGGPGTQDGDELAERPSRPWQQR